MQSEDIGYGPNCATWGFPIEAIKAESDADLQKIYTSLECPVCHQFPKTGQNIYSCKLNRHMICEACLPESRICPACQDTISSEKSFAVETCISNFIIPCKYKFEGCHEIIRAENVNEHLSNCTYRPIACVMAKCNEIVPFTQLFKHLLQAHAEKVNGIEDLNTAIVEFWIEGDVNATARYPPFFLTCYDCVFLHMCVSTIHGTWVWCQVCASDEEAKRFKVEMKMENIESGLSIQWIGPVHSVRKSVKEIIASGQVFVINSKEIRNPFLFKKTNDHKNFWKTEVFIHQLSHKLPTQVFKYLETHDLKKNSLSKPRDNSWMYQVEQNPQNAAILTTKPPEPVPISGPGQTTEDIQRISSTETLFKEMDAKHIAEIQGDTSQVETVAPPEILPVEEPPPPVNDIITEQVATLGSPEIPSSPQQISLNDETETINTAEKVDDMLPTDQVTSTQIQPQIDEAVDQIALESLPQMSSVEEIDISATLDTATPAAQITNDDSNLLPNSEAEKPSMDGQQQENDT